VQGPGPSRLRLCGKGTVMSRAPRCSRPPIAETDPAGICPYSVTAVNVAFRLQCVRRIRKALSRRLEEVIAFLAPYDGIAPHSSKDLQSWSEQRILLVGTLERTKVADPVPMVPPAASRGPRRMPAPLTPRAPSGITTPRPYLHKGKGRTIWEATATSRARGDGAPDGPAPHRPTWHSEGFALTARASDYHRGPYHYLTSRGEETNPRIVDKSKWRTREGFQILEGGGLKTPRPPPTDFINGGLPWITSQVVLTMEKIRFATPRDVWQGGAKGVSSQGGARAFTPIVGRTRVGSAVDKKNPIGSVL